MTVMQKVKQFYDNFQYNRDTKAADKIISRMENIVKHRLMSSVTDLSPQQRGNDTGFSNSNPIAARLAKFLGRVFSSQRSYFGANSGYNMQRFANAHHTETFIARVVDQYIVSVLQKGYTFVGNDASAVNYIQKRLFEMEQVSGITFRSLIEKTVLQLLVFGNSFLSVVRNTKASSGSTWKRFDGKLFDPIAAIEAQDTIAMRVDYDYDKNRPVKYYQLKKSTYGDNGSQVASNSTKGRVTNDTEVSSWTPYDITHIKFHPAPGKLWAMPPFQPVLEDILALRELEECIQLLVFQYGHILLHGRVELDNPDEKQAEINNIVSQLQMMEGNGAIVTGAETTFAAIGAEGKAIRAEGYLQYFQQRVLAGLFTSSISMGQGSTSNRNTSDFIDKQKQEVTKDLQAIIADAFQLFFDQLLMEGGKSVDYVWKNRVSLAFPDPDTDSRVKIEQHIMLLYQSNCITEPEMRKMIGLKSLTDQERSELYYQNITLDQTEKSAQITSKLQQANNSGAASNTNSKGNSKSDKTKATKKTATQTSRPTNQHGTKTGPGSIKNSEDFDIFLYPDVHDNNVENM